MLTLPFLGHVISNTQISYGLCSETQHCLLALGIGWNLQPSLGFNSSFLSSVLPMTSECARVYLSGHHTHGFYVSIQIKVNSPSFGWVKSHLVFILMEEELSKWEQPWASLELIAESLVPPLTVFSAAAPPKHSFVKHRIAVDQQLLLCYNKQSINNTFIVAIIILLIALLWSLWSVNWSQSLRSQENGVYGSHHNRFLNSIYGTCHWQCFMCSNGRVLGLQADGCFRRPLCLSRTALTIISPLQD